MYVWVRFPVPNPPILPPGLDPDTADYLLRLLQPMPTGGLTVDQLATIPAKSQGFPDPSAIDPNSGPAWLATQPATTDGPSLQQLMGVPPLSDLTLEPPAPQPPASKTGTDQSATTPATPATDTPAPNTPAPDAPATPATATPPPDAPAPAAPAGAPQQQTDTGAGVVTPVLPQPDPIPVTPPVPQNEVVAPISQPAADTIPIVPTPIAPIAQPADPPLGSLGGTADIGDIGGGD